MVQIMVYGKPKSIISTIKFTYKDFYGVVKEEVHGGDAVNYTNHSDTTQSCVQNRQTDLK